MTEPRNAPDVAEFTPDRAPRASAQVAPVAQPDQRDRKQRDPDASASAGSSRRILGMRVDATSYEAATGDIIDRAEARAGGMIAAANVHMLMEAFDDPSFAGCMRMADLVTADGMPLVWSLRALGVDAASRVYGPTLMQHVCRRAELYDVPVGFYGGAPDVLDALVRSTSERFPKLRVVFAASPPFRALDAAEAEQVCEAIDGAGVGVLFVGLGCPKQERFMARHRDRLGCVMLGVGAAFDFHAGAKRQAPAWIQDHGLEWLFRLACEPRRLWRRYLLGNPRFVFHFSKQLVSEHRWFHSQLHRRS